MMKSLGEILKKQIKQTPVWRHVGASLIVEKTNDILKDMFGQESKKFSQAVYFKDSVIAITCLSSVIAQEIKLNEKKIISAINDKLGRQIVQKIRYLA